MSEGLFTEAYRNRMLAKLAAKLDGEYAAVRMVANQNHASGFIAQSAYDIGRDEFKTCISCGSSTQPCCGH